MKRAMVRFPALVLAALTLATSACGSDKPSNVATSPTPSATALGADQYVQNASAFVDAANWDAAATVRLELGEMYFKPEVLTFEAGKPYKVEIVNAGKKDHEFVAGDFFRSIATRKAEDTSAEVKVPYFTEVEVLAGKSTELLFVAVMPGTFEMLCEIEGHREEGMEGTITVTGSPPTVPAPVLAGITTGSWVQNGPALVEAANWDAKKTLRIELGEMFFKPKAIALTVGTPYVLQIVNTGKKKHEFVADDFFGSIAFRKAQDLLGEYKGPTLKEVEVFAGKQLDLYVIPTKAGSYLLVCEIEGHREEGMEGTITVSAA
ncbi:MAG: cupredoxin domain-containing protein [Actinomycetota bacterium]